MKNFSENDSAKKIPEEKFKDVCRKHRMKASAFGITMQMLVLLRWFLFKCFRLFVYFSMNNFNRRFQIYLNNQSGFAFQTPLANSYCCKTLARFESFYDLLKPFAVRRANERVFMNCSRNLEGDFFLRSKTKSDDYFKRVSKTLNTTGTTNCVNLSHLTSIQVSRAWSSEI